MVAREKMARAARRPNSFSPHCVSLTSREIRCLTMLRKPAVAMVRDRRRRATCRAPAMSRAPKTTSHVPLWIHWYPSRKAVNSKGRSASVKATTRPVARSMAVRTAQPLPRCPARRTVENRGPKAPANWAVRSLLPSSATTTR